MMTLFVGVRVYTETYIGDTFCDCESFYRDIENGDTFCGGESFFVGVRVYTET